MTEEQGNDILYFLQEISSKLTTITDRLESVEQVLEGVQRNTHSTYNLGDIHSKLGDVIEALNNGR